MPHDVHPDEPELSDFERRVLANEDLVTALDRALAADQYVPAPHLLRRQVDALADTPDLGSQPRKARPKASWRYAVTRETYTEPDGSQGELFAIREIYYGLAEDGSVVPTDQPIAAVEDTLEQLRITLQRMLDALDRPILDISTDPPTFIGTA